MAEETTTDGTTDTIPVTEEVGQDAEAPTGDTTSGSGIPTGRGAPPPADTAPPDSEVEIVPEPDAPTGDSTPPNPAEPVKGDPSAEAPPGDLVEGDPSAVEVPLDDSTESGAAPVPDGAVDEPPPVPEVIDPSTDTVVVSGAIDESGTQTILIDRDGDGLLESRVEGVDLGNGTFKVVSEPELLDEPVDPSEVRATPEEPAADAAAPPEDAAAPPDLPEPGEVFDGADLPGGATNEDGSQEFLFDTDGDGLFDTSVIGVPTGDGQFKVVESTPLDEPIPDPRGASPEPDAGTGTPEITDDNADEANDELPQPGEFIDPNEVDVVETRPGFFEADLDGDGTNDVEFRGRVGDDGLIEVGQARPIGDDAAEAGTGTPEITPDNADEAGTDEPINEFEDQKPEVPRGPEGEEPTGNEVVGDEDNPPTGEELIVERREIPPDQELEVSDGERPGREGRPDPEGEGSSEVEVVETPDAPPTGDEPPPTPKEEAVGDGSPPGIGEIEDIPPDQEPDPVDRLRPDRGGEADPGAGDAPDVPPLPNEIPEGGAKPVDLSPEDDAPVEPPAGEVAPQPPAADPPAHEPPAAGHEPPAEAEVDLPGLYDAPPAYASGSDGGGHAPPSGHGEPGSTAPVDDDGGYVPDVPAADVEPETDDGADEPIEVNATDGDGDDAGLLEQVADAVGDLWDDAKDVVT